MRFGRKRADWYRKSLTVYRTAGQCRNRELALQAELAADYRRAQCKDCNKNLVSQPTARMGNRPEPAARTGPPGSPE